MPLNLGWAQPNPALGPTYGLEYYAGIVGHVGMIFGALGIVIGFLYMYMIHDPESRKKGIKIVLGSAIGLVFLALLPTLIDQFLVPTGSDFGITQQSVGGWGSSTTGSIPAPSSSWLGNLITGALGFILGSVVRAILTLATALLNVTLFHTYSLVDGGQFAQTVWNFYKVTAPIATGILAILLAYSFTKQAVGSSLFETGYTFDRTNLDPRILIPRAIAATLMAWCGFYVVGFLLEVSNYFVNFFLDQTYNSLFQSLLQSLGSGLAGLGATLALGAIWELMWPLVLLVLFSLIIWIVVTYFVRLFEITFLTAALPIAAAFWTMNETSNIWSAYIAEIFGAIFVQPLQVFLWWIVVKLLVGGGLGGTGIAGGASNFVEGIVGIFFVAAAPRMLKSFIGHNVAGGSLTGQVLEAMGVRSAVSNAWKMSPASDVFNKAKEALHERNEQKIRSWGDSGGSSVISKIGGISGRVAGTYAGAAANIGSGIAAGFQGAANVFAAGGPLGPRFKSSAQAAFHGIQTGFVGGGWMNRLSNGGAQVGANVTDPRGMAARAFRYSETSAGVNRSRNQLAHERAMQENPEIAKNNLTTNVIKEERGSDARITNPDLTHREQFAHKQNEIASQMVWNDPEKSKPLYRLSMENEIAKKQIGQKYGSYKREAAKNHAIPRVGEAAMNANDKVRQREIKSILNQNRAVYNYVIAGRKP